MTTLDIDEIVGLGNIGKISLRLMFQETMTEVNGEVYSRQIGLPYWEAEISTAEMENSKISEIYASLLLLNGSQNSAYIYDPRKAYPKMDSAGEVISGSTVLLKSVNFDEQKISLKGLPVGYVLSKGDMLSFDYSTSKRGLHIINETVTSDGSGETSEFKISPIMKLGAAVDDEVQIAKPSAKMRLLQSSVTNESVSAFTSIISFSLRQTHL